MVNCGNSSAFAFVNFEETFALRIEAEVHVAVDHNSCGLRQVQQSRGLDEGEENCRIAFEAELVVAWHFFGGFLDFYHHFVLCYLFAQFQQFSVVQSA